MGPAFFVLIQECAVGLQYKNPPTSDICPHNAEKIEQKFQNYEKKYNYNC